MFDSFRGVLLRENAVAGHRSLIRVNAVRRTLRALHGVFVQTARVRLFAGFFNSLVGRTSRGLRGIKSLCHVPPLHKKDGTQGPQVAP